MSRQQRVVEFHEQSLEEKLEPYFQAIEAAMYSTPEAANAAAQRLEEERREERENYGRL